MTSFLGWSMLAMLGVITVYGYIRIVSRAYHEKLKDDFPFDED